VSLPPQGGGGKAGRSRVTKPRFHGILGSTPMTIDLPMNARRCPCRSVPALAASLHVASAFASMPSAGAAEVTDYRHDVLPIMKSHCWECHSSEHEVKGSLALDDLDEVRDYQIGEHNLIRPGNPERSDFLMRLKLDPAEHDFMPRDGKALRSRELATIEKWIAEGAIVDREHPSENEAARMKGAAERVAFLPWTNLEGRTIEARFQKLEGETLAILLRDGRRAEVSLETLDETSREQARRIAANQ